MTKIGSTKKGGGAALIQRIRRDPDDMNIASVALRGTPFHSCVTTTNSYNKAVRQARIVQIEGAQGYSLSLYHGFYPYCTSRDISTAQVLADCGVPYNAPTEVIGTARTYPIRVANRFDSAGKQVGYSGPHYTDQIELSWSHLGMQPELTTVTKLPRRLFSFSRQQIIDAARLLGVTSIFLNFVNYLPDRKSLDALLEQIERDLREDLAGSMVRLPFMVPYVRYVGDGPCVTDVHDLQYDALNEVKTREQSNDVAA